MIDSRQEGVLLALFHLDGERHVRIRRLPAPGGSVVDIRIWRYTADGWVPEEGLSIPNDQLAPFSRTVQAAARTIGSRAIGEEPEGRMSWERVRRLARQVAAARERLAALRPEDYRRPQDYRRVCTVRRLELMRGEKLLREAEAQLRAEEALRDLEGAA